MNIADGITKCSVTHPHTNTCKHSDPIYKRHLKNLKIHAKGGITGGSTEERTDLFFAQIPKPLILQLYEYCRRDYEMFGYPSPYKYM